MTKEQRIILENRVKDVLPGLNTGEIEKLLPILRKAWAMGYFDALGKRDYYDTYEGTMTFGEEGR